MFDIHNVRGSMKFLYCHRICSKCCPYGLNTSFKLYVPFIGHSTLFHRAASGAYLCHTFSSFLRKLSHQFHKSIAF